MVSTCPEGQQKQPRSQHSELTITQRKLSEEPTGVLHCLSSVTALKGGHAPHCGEPDCSGVIDQLPGVIPRYREVKANTGKNTLNLLSQPSSRQQGESSSFPQAIKLNTSRDSGITYFILLVQIFPLNLFSVLRSQDSEKRTQTKYVESVAEVQTKETSQSPLHKQQIKDFRLH